MIRTAEDMYRACLDELNRTRTIGLKPDRFNYHVNVAFFEWLKLRYWAFDRHQKAIDDLGLLTNVTDGVAGNPPPIPNTGLTAPGGEVFDVPADIMGLEESMFILQVWFTPVYHGSNCYPEGHVGRPVVAEYYTHNRHSRNPYNRSSEERFFWLMNAGRIRRVVTGTEGAMAQDCVLHYLRYPRKITVDPATGLGTGEPELGPSQNAEIVKWTVASYLENIESLRTRTMMEIQGSTFVHQTASGQ